MPRFHEARITTTLARGVERTPGVYHGAAVLAGTRFPTAFIGGMVLDDGYLPEQVPRFWSWLTMTQVKQALAYERRLRREKRKRRA